MAKLQYRQTQQPHVRHFPQISRAFLSKYFGETTRKAFLRLQLLWFHFCAFEGRGIFPDSILCFLTHNSPPISQIFNNFQVMLSSSHLLYLAFCVFCFWVGLIRGCSMYFLCVCVCLWGGFSLFLCDFLSVCWWVLVIWFVGGFWSYHF